MFLLSLAMAGPAMAAPSSRPPGAQSCIDPRLIGSRTAEGDATILFRVGPKAYRNHLRGPCPGLSRLNNFGTLETEPTGGGQLCEGDTVRVLDPNSMHGLGINAYPRCLLGWFEPVTPAKP
jgi:hypothetical protein